MVWIFKGALNRLPFSMLVIKYFWRHVLKDLQDPSWKSIVILGKIEINNRMEECKGLQIGEGMLSSILLRSPERLLETI
jgi:hypothetical protein